MTARFPAAAPAQTPRSGAFPGRPGGGRALLAGAAALALAAAAVAPGPARAGGTAAGTEAAPRTALSVTFRVARAEGGAAVLDRSTLEAMTARAAELLGPAGVCFAAGGFDELSAGAHLDLVGRADRHALAAAAPRSPGAIEVFVVRSLADLDVRGGILAGVHWRWAGAGKAHAGRRYVILSATGAGPDTLGHELGHFLGLGHSKDPANLMAPAPMRTSTDLTPAQRARIRASLAAALRRGELAPRPAAAGADPCRRGA